MIIQPKHAQDPSHYYKPASLQKLTVDDTVRSPTIPAGARAAKVFFRVATVRLTMDETDPVAGTTGIPHYDGYEEVYSIFELQVLRLIREGATSGEVYFQYYN